jgi:tRNA nucleotidyltransferase/poly(A) polymerase
VHSNRHLLLHLPAERLRHEIQTLLKHGAAVAAVMMMGQLGLMEMLLPVHYHHLMTR